MRQQAHSPQPLSGARSWLMSGWQALAPLTGA